MKDKNNFADQDLNSLEVTREEAHQDAPGYAQRTIKALRNIKGSLLANAMAADYEKKKMVSLIGLNIANSTDLAVAAQMYRNPSFETFRTFYVRQGCIVGQTGVTSRMPGSASVLPPGSAREDLIAAVKDQMAKTGADGYYMMHNHPSGNLEASFQDMEVTKVFSNNIDGFLGHIIVNEKRYAFIDPKLKIDYFDIADVKPEYDLSKQAKSSPVLGKLITGPGTIAQIGTEYYRKDYVTLIGRRGTTGAVNGLAEIHVSELTQKENRHLIALVRAFQRQTASMDVIIANVPAKVKFSSIGDMRKQQTFCFIAVKRCCAWRVIKVGHDHPTILSAFF